MLDAKRREQQQQTNYSSPTSDSVRRQEEEELRKKQAEKEEFEKERIVTNKLKAEIRRKEKEEKAEQTRKLQAEITRFNRVTSQGSLLFLCMLFSALITFLRSRHRLPEARPQRQPPQPNGHNNEALRWQIGRVGLSPPPSLRLVSSPLRLCLFFLFSFLFLSSYFLV
jgi:hypothetical protein